MSTLSKAEGTIRITPPTSPKIPVSIRQIIKDVFPETTEKIGDKKLTEIMPKITKAIFAARNSEYAAKKKQNQNTNPQELAKQITTEEVRNRRELILGTITAETGVEALDKPKTGRTSGLSHKF